MKVQFHMLDGSVIHAKMNDDAVSVVAGLNRFIMGADIVVADGSHVFNGKLYEMSLEQSAALDTMAKEFSDVEEIVDQTAADRRDAALENGDATIWVTSPDGKAYEATAAREQVKKLTAAVSGQGKAASCRSTDADEVEVNYAKLRAETENVIAEFDRYKRANPDKREQRWLGYEIDRIRKENVELKSKLHIAKVRCNDFTDMTEAEVRAAFAIIDAEAQAVEAARAKPAALLLNRTRP